MNVFHIIAWVFVLCVSLTMSSLTNNNDTRGNLYPIHGSPHLRRHVRTPSPDHYTYNASRLNAETAELVLEWNDTKTTSEPEDVTMFALAISIVVLVFVAYWCCCVFPVWSYILS
jgi:hypothetical protein